MEQFQLSLYIPTDSVIIPCVCVCVLLTRAQRYEVPASDDQISPPVSHQLSVEQTASYPLANQIKEGRVQRGRGKERRGEREERERGKERGERGGQGEKK